MRSRIRILILLLLLATATTAFADEGKDSQGAKALFEEGVRRVDAGKCGEAITFFQQSLALMPSVGAWINLGDCQMAKNDALRAWNSYREAELLAASKSDARAAKAQKLVADVSSKLLVIKITNQLPPGADVRVGNDKVTPSLLAGGVLAASTGDVVLHAEAANHAPLDVSAKGAIGASVAVTLGPMVPTATATAKEPAPVAATQATPTPEASTPTPGWIGWTFVAAGAVGLGVGGFFFVRMNSAISERDSLCPNELCPRALSADDRARAHDEDDAAHTARLGGVIASAVGAALVGTGLYLVLGKKAPVTTARGAGFAF